MIVIFNNAYMLLNINYLNLSINNYAVAGRWGIKDFVCPYPNETIEFLPVSVENRNNSEKGVQSGCAQKQNPLKIRGFYLCNCSP